MKIEIKELVLNDKRVKLQKRGVFINDSQVAVVTTNKNMSTTIKTDNRTIEAMWLMSEPQIICEVLDLIR